MTRPTPRLSRLSPSSFHILAFGIAMTCLSFVATPGTHAASTDTFVSAAKAKPVVEMQLADEITRRLRRIGLNFNRARLPRPYDPAGEIC